MKIQFFLGPNSFIYKIEVNNNVISFFYDPQMSLAAEDYYFHKAKGSAGECAYQLRVAMKSALASMPEFQRETKVTELDRDHKELHLDTVDLNVGRGLYHAHHRFRGNVKLSMLRDVITRIAASDSKVSVVCSKIGIKNIDLKTAEKALQEMEANYASGCRVIKIGSGLKTDVLANAAQCPTVEGTPYRPEPLSSIQMKRLDTYIETGTLPPPVATTEASTAIGIMKIGSVVLAAIVAGFFCCKRSIKQEKGQVDSKRLNKHRLKI